MYFREACLKRVALLFGLSATLFGCLVLHVSRPVQAAEGAVAENCEEVTSQWAALSPRKLYDKAGRCFTQNKTEAAVTFYALAAAYAQFDMRRVPDVTAHPVITREPMATQQLLTPAERIQFHQATLDRQRNPEAMQRMCVQLRQAGPPQYVPTYMAKFGEYDSPAGTGRPIKVITQPVREWERILDEFIGCSR